MFSNGKVTDGETCLGEAYLGDNQEEDSLTHAYWKSEGRSKKHELVTKDAMCWVG